jgi:predicted nucleic acid-binding protein
MRIVIDANILYSSLLNIDGEIAKLIFKSNKRLNFYSTNLLFEEILEHSEKLLKVTGYTKSELRKQLSLLEKKIKIVDVRLIPKNYIKTAISLLQDIDIDDVEYVALTDHIKGKLWTGDKILIKGLQRKGWNKFISVREIKLLSTSKRKK